MKSDRIRRLLAKGLSAAEIAKRLKVKASYVHTIKWLDKKANAKKKVQVERSHDPKVKKAEKKYLKAVKTQKPSKIIKAVKEMKQALDAVDDAGKTILDKTGKIKEGTRIGGLTLRRLPGDMWTWKKETKKDLENKPTKLIVQPQYKAAALKLLDMKEADLVNKPPHYTDGGVDTLKFIEAKDLNYRLGNVVKYISRAGKKVGSDPVQDLEKARFYLEREIEARRDA